MGIKKQELTTVTCGADPLSIIEALQEVPNGAALRDLEVVEEVRAWEPEYLLNGPVVRLTFARAVS